MKDCSFYLANFFINIKFLTCSLSMSVMSNMFIENYSSREYQVYKLLAEYRKGISAFIWYDTSMVLLRCASFTPFSHLTCSAQGYKCPSNIPRRTGGRKKLIPSFLSQLSQGRHSPTGHNKTPPELFLWDKPILNTIIQYTSVVMCLNWSHTNRCTVQEQWQNEVVVLVYETLPYLYLIDT